MRLKGKTALITGGGEGIGEATALLFCKEGAKVGITGRTKSKLDNVIKEAKGKGEIVAFPGDVSSEAHVKDTVKKFLKRFKKIDILFNNAGVLEAGNVLTTMAMTGTKYFFTRKISTSLLRHWVSPWIM